MSNVVYTRRLKKIFKDTKAYMESLGTYRCEFDVLIMRYSEMRIQYDTIFECWQENGCQITEPYTNKAGATNERKTALYGVIEKLRSELTAMETLLGMTPKGLQGMKKKGLEDSKKTELDKLLGGD